MAKGVRKDFAVIYSRAFQDRRVFDAAKGIPGNDLQHLTAIGCIAALSCFLIRDGETGILEGDGIGPAMMALGCNRGTAEAVVASMTDAGLLTSVPTGLYLKGFTEAYESLIKKRRKAREEAQDDDNPAPTLEQPCANPAPRLRPTSGSTGAVAVDGASEKTKSKTPLKSAAFFQGNGSCDKCDENGALKGTVVSCRCPRGRARALRMAKAQYADEEQAKRAAEARLERPAPYDPNGAL